MTQRETFAEFAERVKPKGGDTFKDSRGNAWKFTNHVWPKFSIGDAEMFCSRRDTGAFVAHDFIEPVKPKLLAPAFFKMYNKDMTDKIISDSSSLFSSAEEARLFHGHDFVSWPAIPNAQGYYEVGE